MAARPIASGTISFGLISIPVRLFSAAGHPSPIRFNLLSGEAETRLEQQYIDAMDESRAPRAAVGGEG